MARVIHIIGWAFILLAIFVVGAMGVMAVMGPPLTDATGAVWIRVHPFSLGQFQVLIQRTLGLPDLWDNYLVPVLQAPAWQTMGVLALISFVLGLLLLFSAKSRRRAGIIHENGN